MLGAGPARSAAAPGDITTVAGTGVGGFSGDGGPAAAARINGPRGVTWMPGGGFLFADLGNSRVRRVYPDGNIATVAGTGTNGYSGDGGQATAARLNNVHGVAALPEGAFLIDDTRNNRIRRVAPDGTIATVAGSGVQGYSGDSGPATAARINDPRGIAAMPDGGFLIADSGNHRVRRVSPTGTITTVAGTGTPGYSGDGGMATKAMLNLPFGVSPTADGGFLIADNTNNRVRRVSPDGKITTVAGDGSGGYSGDGGPALGAGVRPAAVTSTDDGGFLIADNQANRVRHVSLAGTITTVAGTGAATSGGDGGPATDAGIYGPRGVATRPDGDLLIAEFGGNRVRYVDFDTPASSTTYDRAVLGTAGLMSYWRLGERSGSTANDAKGVRNGTYFGPLLGQPGALSGDPDTAAGFDGVNDYVQVPDFAPPTDLSLEAWIYPQDIATGKDRVVIDKGNAEYDLRINANGNLMFVSGNPIRTATDDGFVYHAPANANRWHHVVVTFDSAADTVRFYRNGALTKTVTGFTAAIQNTSFPFRIGRHSQYPGLPPFSGRIDEVALYATPLPQPTIREHWEAGAP